MLARLGRACTSRGSSPAALARAAMVWRRRTSRGLRMDRRALRDAATTDHLDRRTPRLHLRVAIGEAMAPGTACPRGRRGARGSAVRSWNRDFRDPGSLTRESPLLSRRFTSLSPRTTGCTSCGEGSILVRRCPWKSPRDSHRHATGCSDEARQHGQRCGHKLRTSHGPRREALPCVQSDETAHLLLAARDGPALQDLPHAVSPPVDRHPS